MLPRFSLRQVTERPAWLPAHPGCVTRVQRLHVYANEDTTSSFMGGIAYTCDGPCWAARNTRLRSHSNEFYLEVFWHRGPTSIRVAMDTQEVTLLPGQYMVFNPRDRIVRYEAGATMFRGVDLFFSQSFLRIAREAMGIPRWAGPFDFASAPRRPPPSIRSAMDRLVQLIARPAQPGTEVADCLAAYGAGLVLLARLWQGHPSEVQERMKAIRYRFHLDPRVERALQHIYRHYHRPLTSDALAEEVGVTERTLDRLFHKAFHASPRAFLQRYRVEQADLIRREKPLSMKALAERVGLGSAYALRKAREAVRRADPSALPIDWRSG